MFEIWHRSLVVRGTGKVRFGVVWDGGKEGDGYNPKEPQCSFHREHEVTDMEEEPDLFLLYHNIAAYLPWVRQSISLW